VKPPGPPGVHQLRPCRHRGHCRLSSRRYRPGLARVLRPLEQGSGGPCNAVRPKTDPAIYAVGHRATGSDSGSLWETV